MFNDGTDDEVTTDDHDQPTHAGSWMDVVRLRGKNRHQLRRQRQKISTRSDGPASDDNSLVARRQPSGCGLRGAQPTQTQPFHLSGISLESSASDMLGYCQKKGITATGCFLLPSRIWHGTRTAKLFAAVSCLETITNVSFWPDHMSCCVWKTDSPSSSTKSACTTSLSPGSAKDLP